MRLDSTRPRQALLFVAPIAWGLVTWIMTSGVHDANNVTLGVAVALAMTAGLALGLTCTRSRES